MGELFVSEQEALAEARRRWGNKATVHTAPIPFFKTVSFCRVGIGKRWFLAELLGEVKAVKGAGLTWERPLPMPAAAFRDSASVRDFTRRCGSHNGIPCPRRTGA